MFPKIFDGDDPFEARGCIARAWSVAELLRVTVTLADFDRRPDRVGEGDTGPKN